MEPEKNVPAPEAEVTPVVEKPLEEMTAEEIEAKAKAIENENKTLKESRSTDEIKQNQMIRLNKALAKNGELKGEQQQPEKLAQFDVEDLLTLRLNNIPKDSDKAKILEKYKNGGLVDTYENALTHPGVMAELAAIDAKNTAETVIDESDKNSEGYTKTKKEVLHQYQNQGVIPKDPKLQEIIATDNLKAMGL